MESFINLVSSSSSSSASTSTTSQSLLPFVSSGTMHSSYSNSMLNCSLNSHANANNNNNYYNNTMNENGNIMKNNFLMLMDSKDKINLNNTNHILVDSTNIERPHQPLCYTPQWSTRPPRGTINNFFSGSSSLMSSSGKRKVKNKSNKESKVRHLSSTCRANNNEIDFTGMRSGNNSASTQSAKGSKHIGCKKTHLFGRQEEVDFSNHDDSSSGSSPPKNRKGNKKTITSQMRQTQIGDAKTSVSWIQSLRRKKQTNYDDSIVNRNNKKTSNSSTNDDERFHRISNFHKKISYSSCLTAVSVADCMNVPNDTTMLNSNRDPFMETRTSTSLLSVRNQKDASSLKSSDDIREQASQIADEYIQNSLAESKMVVDCARAVLKDCIRERTYSSSGWKKSEGSPERNVHDWRRFVHSLTDDETFEPMKSSSSTINISDDDTNTRNESRNDNDRESLPPWRRYLSSSTDEELSAIMKAPSSSSWSDSNDAWRQFNNSNDDWRASEFEMNDDETLVKEKGLPVEARYQLPLSLSTAAEADVACSICQNNFSIGEHITTLPCKHYFHAICADRWLWNHISCPICRAEIDVNQVLNPQETLHDGAKENISAKEKEDTRRRLRILSYGANSTNNIKYASDNSDGANRGECMLNQIICAVTVRRKV